MRVYHHGVARVWHMVAAVAVAAALATTIACGGPRTFTLSFDGGRGVAAIPITLDDRSGLVIALEQSFGQLVLGTPISPVSNEPGHPDRLHVLWAGGACDTAVAMDLAGEPTLLRLTIRATRPAPGCRPNDVGREVVVTFSRPISAASVRVTLAP